MAGDKKEVKNKVDDDEMDFGDFDDLDDMDFDSDLDDLDNRNPGKTEIAKELAEEGGKGFLEGLIKKSAKNALPEEYDSHYSEAMDYADFTGEMVGKSKSKIKKSLYGLGKEVKKILPFQSKMLDGFLERYAEENIQAKQASEEAMRDSAIAGTLGSIFDKQLEVQKALAARGEAKDEAETKRAMISDKFQTDLLSSIDNNLAQSTAFSLQIGKEYFRKSLELQYKSYYVQADLLKTSRDYFKGFSAQLDNVVKNTGLPDYVKLTNTERLGEKIRDKTMESIQTRLWDKNKYVQGIKKRVESMVSSKVSEVTDKIDSATDMIGGISSAAENPQQVATLLTSIFSGMGGTVLGERLANRLITPNVKARIADNKAIQGGASALTSMANSPDTFLAYLRERNAKGIDDFADESTPMRMLRSLFHKGSGSLLNLTTPEALGGKLDSTGIMSHNKPAIFDNKVHRSITETIPMYLSRILKENTDLTKMYSTVNTGSLRNFKGSETLMYNYQDRKLSTEEEFRKSVETNVLAGDVKRSRISSMSSDIIGRARTNASKSELKLLGSKTARGKLEKLITDMDSAGMKEFDVESLLKAKEGTVIGDRIQGDPELRKILELIHSKSTKESRESLSSSFRDIGERYPSTAAKEFFRGVSKLAGQSSYNNISDEAGSAFTRTLFRFGMSRQQGGFGKRATIKSFVDGDILRVVGESDAPLLKEPLIVLINEARMIYTREEEQLNLAFTALLGMVQSEANNLASVPKEVFQELYDGYPHLFESREVGQEQLVEGLLTKTGFTAAFQASDVKDIIRTSKVDVDNLRSKATLTRFESSLDSRLKGITSSVGNVGDRLASASQGKTGLARISSLIQEGTAIAKDAISETTAQLKKTYASVAKEAEDLGKILNVKSEKLIMDSLGKASGIVDRMATNITKAAADEKLALEERVKILRDLEKNISEGTTASTRNIENEIKAVESISNRKIKLLEDYGNEAKRLAIEIRSITQSSGEGSTIEVARKLLTTLQDFSKRSEDAMNQAKEIEA